MPEQEELLIPQEEYLKFGIHIGTKFKTKYMERFIYKTRNDGLSILNLQEIDKRIRLCAKFLSYYNPEDILVVSRRENSIKAVKEFGNLTKCKVFVVDPWPDRNAILDAL